MTTQAESLRAALYAEIGKRLTDARVDDVMRQSAIPLHGRPVDPLSRYVAALVRSDAMRAIDAALAATPPAEGLDVERLRTIVAIAQGRLDAVRAGRGEPIVFGRLADDLEDIAVALRAEDGAAGLSTDSGQRVSLPRSSRLPLSSLASTTQAPRSDDESTTPPAEPVRGSREEVDFNLPHLCSDHNHATPPTEGLDALDGARLEYRECMEVRRLLGYLWTATGFRSEGLAVRDLFAPDDPLVADVERLAIFATPPAEGETEPCPTCMQPVYVPQRGDHDYGIPLRATPPAEGLDVLRAVRDWIAFGAGDGTEQAEAESERLLGHIVTAWDAYATPPADTALDAPE